MLLSTKKYTIAYQAKPVMLGIYLTNTVLYIITAATITTTTATVRAERVQPASSASTVEPIATMFSVEVISSITRPHFLCHEDLKSYTVVLESGRCTVFII